MTWARVTCCCRPVYSSRSRILLGLWSLHVEHPDEPNAKPNHPLPSEKRPVDLSPNRKGPPSFAVHDSPTAHSLRPRRPRTTLVRSIRRLGRASPATGGSPRGKLQRP